MLLVHMVSRKHLLILFPELNSKSGLTLEVDAVLIETQQGIDSAMNFKYQGGFVKRETFFSVLQRKAVFPDFFNIHPGYISCKGNRIMA